MDDQSPFPYQGPLDPAQVSGRDGLIVDLTQRLADHRLTALLGPRRFGKTSVLRRVTADLAAVGPETVWIDLYELTSFADLAISIDRALSAVRGRMGRILSSVAGGLSLQLGVVGVQLSGAARNRPEPTLAARSLLQVLTRTAERHSLVVVFDEFSGVARVPGAAGMLRTELQHHYQHLGIVFAGSEPSTMRLLFGDKAQPFFAQADFVEIGPLARDAVVDIVDAGFDRTGRGAGPVADLVAVLSNGHPQRAMQLADAAWRLTQRGRTADDEIWADAIEAVRGAVDIGLERLFHLYPTGQQKVLRTVAFGGSVYGAMADVLDLASGTATAAVEALIGDGSLERTDGGLVIIDPLLADWIRRRFAP